MIDANDLERMAKARPDECILKGSGVLKLTGAIRQLEREVRELRAGEPDDATYRYACNLAQSIFDSEYASDPDYASGKVKWGLCDTTAGVLTQIDNMVSGMKRVAALAERERFEAFMRRSRTGKGAKKAAALLVQHPNGEYVEDHTQRHWWTWQLALGLAKLHTEERS